MQNRIIKIDGKSVPEIRFAGFTDYRCLGGDKD
jgi:hypothetical protein